MTALQVLQVFFSLRARVTEPTNQRKREITKKFQRNDEHDWDNEEWAYPDRIDFLENRILSLVQIYAQKQNCSIDEALSALINNDSKL